MPSLFKASKNMLEKISTYANQDDCKNKSSINDKDSADEILAKILKREYDEYKFNIANEFNIFKIIHNFTPLPAAISALEKLFEIGSIDNPNYSFRIFDAVFDNLIKIYKKYQDMKNIDKKNLELQDLSIENNEEAILQYALKHIHENANSCNIFSQIYLNANNENAAILYKKLIGIINSNYFPETLNDYYDEL